jgi:hypothetical protein
VIARQNEAVALYTLRGGHTMFSLLVCASLAVQTASAKNTLTGMVRNEAGRPLRHANVFISTAAPRQGTGVL